MTMGRNITWKGAEINKVGLSVDWETFVKISGECFWSLESDNYRGDYSNAKKKLRWEPRTMFKDLVKIMVNGI